MRGRTLALDPISETEYGRLLGEEAKKYASRTTLRDSFCKIESPIIFSRSDFVDTFIGQKLLDYIWIPGNSTIQSARKCLSDNRNDTEFYSGVFDSQLSEDRVVAAYVGEAIPTGGIMRDMFTFSKLADKLKLQSFSIWRKNYHSYKFDPDLSQRQKNSARLLAVSDNFI